MSTSLKRSDFHYELPAHLIAQAPLPQRSSSRLLLLDAARQTCRDRRMQELPQLLRPGDLLVFNDTRVLPARLALRKSTGGRVELLLERALTANRALVQLRDSKSIRQGAVLESAGGQIKVIARHEPFWEVELPQPVTEFFDAFGLVPLPPYIERAEQPLDRERYQSLLARVPGAVAAPTASLHFDQGLLERLAEREIERTTITLHVAAGTFAPIRSESLQEHRMHSECYQIGTDAAAAIAQARASGRRVIAIGTTVARALESAAICGGGAVAAGPAQTTLFIQPGFNFQVIDVLLTNFHLPESTLLMLVAAFAGREWVLAAYAHAVREQYRFFSYGDAMLVFPA